MLENNDLHVTSVEIAQIKASGMGPTTGSKVEFQLSNGKSSGTLPGIEIISDPATYSSLVTKLESTLINKVLIRMNVESTLSKTCSVLIFHTGNNFLVNFALTNQQYEVPGPILIIIGEDIHVFDGKKLNIIEGIVKAGARLDMLLVDSALTLLSPLKRNGLRLFIPDCKELSVTAHFNTTLDILKQKNITNNNCSSKTLKKTDKCLSRL